MRRALLVTIVVACVSLATVGTCVALVDPDNCSISDARLTTCPVDHDPGSAQGTARVVVLYVTLCDELGEFIEGHPASDLMASVGFHEDYPELGAGPGGDCPNCDDHYWAHINPDGYSDGYGQVPIQVYFMEPFCAPSMCCPVQVCVTILSQGQTIPDRGSVIQNSVDMVTAGASGGVVDLSDISAFGIAIRAWVDHMILQPCADFAPDTPGYGWGTISLSDIALLGCHVGHSCEPFGDPCD